MDIICEGDYGNPSKLIVGGEEIQLDLEKWKKAYNAVKDMGITEDSPEFLAAAYDAYKEL